MKTATIMLALTSATSIASVFAISSLDYQKRLRQARKFAARIDKVLMAYDSHMKANLGDWALIDIFVTAIEGGINYWAYRTKYDCDEATATIVEMDHNDNIEDCPVYNINRNTVLRGLRKMQLEKSEGVQGCYSRLMSEDYDSADADLCIQFGVLGEERYA